MSCSYLISASILWTCGELVLGLVLGLVGEGRGRDHDRDQHDVAGTKHWSLPLPRRDASGNSGNPNIVMSAGRAGAAVRTAALQLGRAGARIGGDLGVRGARSPRRTSRRSRGSAAASGRCRDCAGLPERSAMKRLTMRSSSEWKVTTASRPPGFSARSAANSAPASSPSSSLTKMRSAWKTRVAGWILSFGLRPTCVSIASARSSVRSNGRSLAPPLDHARDAAGMPLLAEEAEDAREIARLEAVDDVGGGRAGLAPCACRAARRCGRRSRDRPGRAASTRRRCRARRRRPFRRQARRAARTAPAPGSAAPRMPRRGPRRP